MSPGCENCYAETFAERFRGTPGHYFELGFDVVLRERMLHQPLRWRRPRIVFADSMSDLLHDEVPDTYLAKVFAVIGAAHWHTFVLLTKRHGRLRSRLGDRGHQFSTSVAEAAVELGLPAPPSWPLPNLILGVSAEDQKRAELRIPPLLDVPAAGHAVSCEPLLGAITLTPWLRRRPGLIWVKVGGETGHRARPTHPDWVRDLRDQSVSAGVSFHFKQWGEWGPAPWVVRVCDPATGWRGSEAELRQAKAAAERTGATVAVQLSGHVYTPPHKPWSLERVGTCAGAMRRHGRVAAGRELDGVIWDERPVL